VGGLDLSHVQCCTVGRILPRQEYCYPRDFRAPGPIKSMQVTRRTRDAYRSYRHRPIFGKFPHRLDNDKSLS
jgi:hypothetical protein